MRIGIRGHGVGDRLHCSVWRELPGCKVEFLPRAAPESIAPFDLIIIACPPENQLQSIDAFAPFASMLLCEKPAGINVGQLSAWLSNAAPQAAAAMVNYQLRFLPPAVQSGVRAAMATSAGLTVVYRSSARDRKFDAGCWKQSSARGGGVVRSILSHIVDLLLFSGATQVVLNEASNVKWSGEDPDAAPDALVLRGAVLGPHPHALVIDIDTTVQSSLFTLSWDRACPAVINLVESGGSLRSDSTGPWRNSYVEMARSLRARKKGAVATITDALRVYDVLATADVLLRSGR